MIFAVTNGYVDFVEPENITDYEHQVRDYLRNSHEEILDSIREEQELSDENREKLEDALKKFNENYEPENTGMIDMQVGAEDGSEDEDSEDGSGERG